MRIAYREVQTCRREMEEIKTMAQFAFKPGDLLFQDIYCGPPCDAINGATGGWRGAEINHMAMFVGYEAGGIIVEAIYPMVNYYPLKRFLARSLDSQSRPRVLVGRPIAARQHLIAAALEWAKSCVGLPYDSVFYSGDEAMYCSELVVDAFRVANGGTAVFPEHQMSFADPQTGQVLPFWEKYFEAFGIPVPQGEVGSNPGDLSTSDQLEIVHQFGDLRGCPKA